jgi:hypothetical protein
MPSLLTLSVNLNLVTLKYVNLSVCSLVLLDIPFTLQAFLGF